MLIKELKPEDIKVGMRTYYRAGDLFGTITFIDGMYNIIISWDNGLVNPVLSYKSYVSEVVDDIFFISMKRKKC